MSERRPNPSSNASPNFSARGAALASGALLGSAVVLYLLVGWLEGFGVSLDRLPGKWLADIDRQAALDAVGNAAEVISGLLAMALTVVAIVVELAATRYTHRITDLFIRAPINAVVMSFFVLTAVLCLWIAATFGGQPPQPGPLPHAALWLPLIMVTGCLLILLPYFAFVFAFVSPLNVIKRLRGQARLCILHYPKHGADSRGTVLRIIEELSDLARGALEQNDRAISMAAIDALADLLRDLHETRDNLPDSWFRVEGEVSQDPDFVSMDPRTRESLGRVGGWLEIKVLRQFLDFFRGSLGRTRDVGGFVALATRTLALETAGSEGGGTDLYQKFFNSYLRAAINGSDLRIAYHVLAQYRRLAEQLLEDGRGEQTREIAEYMRYYGQLGDERGMSFLLETVAYDISLLVEHAAQLDGPALDGLLQIFLEVDRPEEPLPGEEDHLLGVRRVQVQLATFFLARDDEPRARLIYQDMAGDRRERLHVIYDELSREERPSYWEFTDRGVNFAYLPPERRAQLATFFSWFGGDLESRD
ncbi:MAG: DUF2254 family protein [Myxococcota bacterium]